jgi:hypothetical protein
MNEWNIDEGDYLDYNALGRRVENFLLRNSEYVIYIRLDRRFPCPHGHSQETLTSKNRDVNCPICMGFGWKVTPQIVPSRLSRGDAELETMGGDLRFDPGYIDHYKYVVSFPRWVYPDTNDLFIACEWNKPTQEIIKPPIGRPLKIGSIYTIKKVNTNFMREISWISCGIKSFEIDSDHIQALIPKFSRLEVLKGSNWAQDNFWK